MKIDFHAFHSAEICWTSSCECLTYFHFAEICSLSKIITFKCHDKILPVKMNWKIYQKIENNFLDLHTHRVWYRFHKTNVCLKEKQLINYYFYCNHITSIQKRNKTYYKQFTWSHWDVHRSNLQSKFHKLFLTINSIALSYSTISKLQQKPHSKQLFNTKEKHKRSKNPEKIQTPPKTQTLTTPNAHPWTPTYLIIGNGSIRGIRVILIAAGAQVA